MQRHRPLFTEGRRSRVIWDETRKPNAPKSALLKAVLYELQPIRFSTIVAFFNDPDSQHNMTQWLDALSTFLRDTLPYALKATCKTTVTFGKERSVKEWAGLGVLYLYWKFIVWVHGAMDAGPVVLILTALVLIFTIGLKDKSENDSEDGLSAYSVFNRGFQNIMGGVDVDNLVAQHAGGGVMGMMMPGQQEGGGDNRQDLRQRAVNEPHVEEVDFAAEENDNGNDGPLPNGNRSRKSGKKARRDNKKKELRKEMQRQREAAAAMGFGTERGDGFAMNRLIEEQALLVNNDGPAFDDEDENGFLNGAE